MVDGRLVSETRRFEGDRAQVRAATVGHALHRLIDLIDGTES
jgi:nicotinamide-nucleotide amidase